MITNIEIVQNEQFQSPLLKYNAKLSASADPLLNVLKSFVFNNVIMAPELQQIEFQGQRMLMAMFEAFKTDPMRLLPLSVQQIWKNAINENNNPDRILCDYLASMSDQQATKTYHQLFSPI